MRPTLPALCLCCIVLAWTKPVLSQAEAPLQTPGYVDSIVQAVRTAAGDLQPARMAYGTGVSWININRTMIKPDTGQWGEGPNYGGPSDKTEEMGVSVLFPDKHGNHAKKH